MPSWPTANSAPTDVNVPSKRLAFASFEGDSAGTRIRVTSKGSKSSKDNSKLVHPAQRHFEAAAERAPFLLQVRPVGAGCCCHDAQKRMMSESRKKPSLDCFPVQVSGKASRAQQHRQQAQKKVASTEGQSNHVNIRRPTARLPNVVTVAVPVGPHSRTRILLSMVELRVKGPLSLS